MISNKIQSHFQSITSKFNRFGKMSKRNNSNLVVQEVHELLERKRVLAEEQRTKGPILMIVGPMDVGKSTITTTLLNFATSAGRKPIYVDLDVGQGSISIPGALGTVRLEYGHDFRRDRDAASSVYFFGYNSPSFLILYYYLLISRLGTTLRLHMESSEEVNFSGAIIDTCGWVEGQGYNCVLTAAESFDVNLVLVLDNKKVYNKLKEDLPCTVEVIFKNKLNGVVNKNKNARRTRRESLVYEYFYGTQHHPLNPYTFKIRFSDLDIYQIIVKEENSKNVKHAVTSVHVYITPELQNSILALSYGGGSNDVALSSVYGFICLLHIDMEQELLTILSPKPKPLPSRIAVNGDIKLRR